MKIYYGKNANVIDVTQICMNKLMSNNIITIPKGDTIRDSYFSDPLPGIHKDILIFKDTKLYNYDEHSVISINLCTNHISTDTCMIKELYNKKVAILFFGLTRTLGRTHESIKKNLFKPLRDNFINYDIFIHTNKIHGEYTNPWSGEKTANYNNEDIDALLQPKYFIYDNQEEIINNINFDTYYTNIGTWEGLVSEELTKYLIKNMCLALYSKKQITLLFDKNIEEYDYAIIIRPDMYMHTKIDINFFNELNDNNIIVPSQDWYNGSCNDRFCIGKPSIVSYYGKLFDDLQEYSKHKSIVSERYLMDKLTERGINIIPKHIKYENLRV